MKYIALVDCNNFFASCEIVRYPDLNGEAICVLSANGTNGGCVIARSYEAKSLGIKMGEPYYTASKQFKDAIFIKADLAYYSLISKKIMMILKDFSPIVEQYSIDEAFLELNGLENLYKMSYEQMILYLKNKIKSEIGIDVSIGLASSKTLAKLACEKAKKGIGIFYLTKELLLNELKMTYIGDIWGIGKKSEKFLRNYAIKTAFEFISQKDDWIKKNLGKNGLDMKQELSGNCISAVSTQKIIRKSIQRTSTFGCYSNDFDYLKKEISLHLKSVFKKLRQKNLKTKELILMLKAKDFTNFSCKIDLKTATNSELDVQQAVFTTLKSVLDTTLKYRASGICALKLIETDFEQLEVFSYNENKKRRKNEKISKLMDNLEQKYGKSIVKIGE